MSHVIGSILSEHDVDRIADRVVSRIRSAVATEIEFGVLEGDLGREIDEVSERLCVSRASMIRLALGVGLRRILGVIGDQVSGRGTGVIGEDPDVDGGES